jgi:HEPN domain-containing protein
MTNNTHTRQGLEQARYCLETAHDNQGLQRYPTVVLNAQLCVEHSAKAVIGCFEEAEWTHDPSRQLYSVINENKTDVKVQNQERELLLAERFGLTPNPERQGADAHDNAGNAYELKSATVGSVGTARDVSLEMLRDWRARYWIVAKGENLDTGFHTDEIYFLSPQMMEEQLTKIEQKIRPDLELRDKVVDLLRDYLDSKDLGHVTYLMTRGASLNNPKIPWGYIQKHGVKIEGNYVERLRELVRQYPLTSAE